MSSATYWIELGVLVRGTVKKAVEASALRHGVTIAKVVDGPGWISCVVTWRFEHPDPAFLNRFMVAFRQYMAELADED
jgi:hypothetical protein